MKKHSIVVAEADKKFMKLTVVTAKQSTSMNLNSL